MAVGELVVGWGGSWCGCPGCGGGEKEEEDGVRKELHFPFGCLFFFPSMDGWVVKCARKCCVTRKGEHKTLFVVYSVWYASK